MSGSTKRPVWVWIISGFYVFSTFWVLAGYALIYSGSVSVSAPQKTYLDSLSPIDHGLTAVRVLVNLTGAASLFLLRRQAFYFFVGAFALNLLMSAWHALTKGWVAALGGSGLVGVLISLGVITAICAYSWRLTKAGVLT